MTGHTPWSEIKHKGTTVYRTYVLTLCSYHKVEEAGLTNELLRETEENLTDLLPNGWWVELREWNEQREGDDDD